MSSRENQVSSQLDKLTIELRTADAARSGEILHRTAEWFVLAGFGQRALDAYQLLLTGPLRLSPRSALVHNVERVLPPLCFALCQPCPPMFTISLANRDGLERHVLDREERYLSQLLRHRNSSPHEDWDADLERRATGEAEPPLDQRERNRFLTNAHRLVQQLITRKEFASAKNLISRYDAACAIGPLPRHDWVSLEMRSLAIAVNFMSADSDGAVTQLRALLADLMAMRDLKNRALFVLAPLRPALSALIDGAARDLLKITPAQVDALFEALKHRVPVQSPAFPTPEDWRRLMEDRSARQFRMAPEKMESFSSQYPEAYAARSGARAAATDAEIAVLEKRLGMLLPPSFASFLRYSNGYTLFDYPRVIFGTAEIEWFVTHNKEYADIWHGETSGEVDDETYAQYGEHQNPLHMRTEYLYSCLQISDEIDGYVYLLNPKTFTPDGDWEAWDFGSKIPGAFRYRSFWDMMRAGSERIDT